VVRKYPSKGQVHDPKVLRDIASLNQQLPMAANHGIAKRTHPRGVIRSDNGCSRQHWVIGANMRRILRGLFDGFHFLLALSVIERAYYDGLP
jgi:hypothetical protein